MKYGYKIKGCDRSLESEIKPNTEIKPTFEDVCCMMLAKLSDESIKKEFEKRFSTGEK